MTCKILLLPKCSFTHKGLYTYAIQFHPELFHASWDQLLVQADRHNRVKMVITLLNLIALTIAARIAVTAAAATPSQQQKIPDKTLTQTVATIHRNFPSCYVDLVAIFTQLDPSLLPSHQPIKYTRGPAWANRYDYWSEANTGSSFLKHLTCVFYSVIVQRVTRKAIVAEHDFLPAHVKPSGNTTASASLQNGPSSRRIRPRFILFFSAFPVYKCAEMAKTMQPGEKYFFPIFIITFSSIPSVSSKCLKSPPILTQGITTTSKLSVCDVLLSQGYYDFGTRRKTTALMDKFSCKASAQLCFENMMNTATESHKRTVWRIQSPFFKGLASDCGRNNLRRLSTKKLIEFLARLVNFTGFQREQDCGETESEKGFLISFYCIKFHGLQGHDMYTFDSSDPSYVVIASELYVRSLPHCIFHVVLPLILLFVCGAMVNARIGGGARSWQKSVKVSLTSFFILLGLACVVWRAQLHVNSAMQPKNANVQTHGPTRELLADSERLLVLLPNHQSCKYEVWRHNHEKEFGPLSRKIQATKEFCSDVKPAGMKAHPNRDTSWPCVQSKRLANSMENQVWAQFYGNNCSLENVTTCRHKGTIQIRELLSRFKLVCVGDLKSELEQLDQDGVRTTAILIPKEFFIGKYSRLWKPSADAMSRENKGTTRQIIFDSQGTWTDVDRIYARSTFPLEDKGTKSKIHLLLRTLAQSGLDTLWKEQLKRQKWVATTRADVYGGAGVSVRKKVTLHSVIEASTSLLQFLALLLLVITVVFIYETALGKAGWKFLVRALALKLEKVADYLGE